MSIERFAVSEFSTLKWSFEEDVANLKSSGIHAIGVWRHKLSDYGEEKGAELLIEREMSVSSLQWAGDFTGAGLMTFSEAIDDARTAIYEAALMGAECLILHPGSRNSHTLRHAMRLIRSAISELLPLARDYGVTLALEPTHPVCGRDWSFMHQLESAAELITEFGSANLGIVYDTFHMGDDEQLLAGLAACADDICLVQLADADFRCTKSPSRQIPGEGVLPLRQMIETLAERGYDGWYELEVFGPDVERYGYDRVVNAGFNAVREISAGIKTSQRQS